MSDFHIGHLPIGGLKPNPRNARRHSQKQLSQIAASIRELGFNSLVVVDEDGVILVGHGRVEGARMAGLRSVPVLGRPPHPRAKDCLRACRQQDRPQCRLGSRSAEGSLARAGWGRNQLRSEVTGFETAEIDLLVDGPTDAERIDRSDICCRTVGRRRRSQGSATSGTSVTTACSAATPVIPHPMRICWRMSVRGWSLPTHPITFRSTVTLAGLVRSSTGSSRWRPAK